MTIQISAPLRAIASRLGWAPFLVLLLAACASQPPTTAPVPAAIPDLAAFDATVRAPRDLELHRLSPYQEEDAFRFLEPAIRAVDSRLAMVEEEAQARRLPFRHVLQAAYGSGFLERNLVGNDLDYLAAVHLGELQLSASDPERTALQLIERIEAYLGVFEEVIRQQDGPDLALWQWRLLDPEGRLKRREELVNRLAASLADVAAGRPHAVLVDSLYGLRVPTILGPEESYLYETTRAQFLSSSVQYLDWMFPGIRELSVMLHWYVDLEVIDGDRPPIALADFPLHPTFVPAGLVLKTEENLIGMVAVGDASHRFLTRVGIERPQAMLDNRLELAPRMLADAERNLQGGDRVKALKRIHQSLDLLAPALEPAEVAAAETAIGAALTSRPVLLCGEIAEMSSLAVEVIEDDRLLAIYRRSWDLGRVLRQLGFGLEALETVLPELATDAAAASDASYAHRETLDRWPGEEERRALIAHLRTIQDLGQRCVDRTLPPAEEIRELARPIRARLVAAGYVAVPVYGLDDGSLGVLPGDVSPAATGGDLEVLVPGPFPVREISIAEIPRDRRDEPVPPSGVFWLQFGGDDELADRRAAALRQALAHDNATFRAADGVAAPVAADFRSPLGARFGSAGEELWERSRTGGRGPVALLGVTDRAAAERLLAGHLAIVGAADEATGWLPPWPESGSLADPLARALTVTAERILEGLAVGRASHGRRGLDVDAALRAQARLHDLVSLMAEWSRGEAELRAHEVTDSMARWELTTDGGTHGLLSLRARRAEPSEQPRLSLRVIANERGETADPLMLRFDVTPHLGAAWDLHFLDPRLDWGVHGGMATVPSQPDHHFPFDLPAVLRRQHDPEAQEAAREAWARWVERLSEG